MGNRLRRRPGRADGLLDRGRAAVLPRARPHLPGRGPLVLLLPGPDLPEPAVPDLGHRPRPGRRPAVGSGELPAGRHDLRRADHQRHLLGELSQREPGLGAAQAAARRARPGRAAATGADRPVAAGSGQRRPRQHVVHRRPVPAGVRALPQSSADHPAVLCRRSGRDAAVGVHRGPGLRRLLGGEPAGHRPRRGVLRRGHQRGDERARLGVDAAAGDLRRARGLLGSRAPPARGRADDVPARNWPPSPQWARSLMGVLLPKSLKSLENADDGPVTYERYGFRVPAVIVSPYAGPDFVLREVLDHTSVLKLIEEKWNLPPLPRRDAAAVSPLGALDLTAPPAFLKPPLLPDAKGGPFRPS